MEGLNMNENPQVNGSWRGTGSSVATGFVLGALVGAGVALLLAPGSGKETRRRITDTGRRWGGAAHDKLDQARATADGLKQDAKAALKAGREAFEQGQRSHEPRPDSRIEQKS
jgi:gas vesicle protein